MRSNTTKTLKPRSNHRHAAPASVSQADWIHRFADCLMLLHPNTVAAVVARHVAAHSPQDSELPPEEAAMKFIFEQPMDDEVARH